MTNLPFSQACENNKGPILKVLKGVFKDACSVLEIGSGTGQHAVYFAQHLPHLTWHTSDREANHPGIHQWLDAHPQANLQAPITLDVTGHWPSLEYDAVYSANTAHIMPWDVTQRMIKKTGESLPSKGVFALYGPMNYNGQFTSPSNAKFDQWLKQQTPEQGIRDFEAVNQIAESVGLNLLKDNPMPANNRLLVWQKIT